MSSRVILGYLVGFLVALSAPAFGQTIPDQPPDIWLDGLFSDRFSQRPTDLYPRIEFISDRNAYFDTTGESHVVAIRVYDEDGNLVSDPALDWATDAPTQLGIAGESGGAVLESLGNWDGPIGYTVSAPDLGVSATGQAIMADIQPGVVRVPSHWVKRVLGDRTAGHEVVLASNAVTDDISSGDIVLSGDYAGVMVHALSVSSDGQGNVVIAAEPAAINDVFSDYQQNVTGEPLLVRIEANERRTRYTIRSQRDDVVLYQRIEPGNNVHSLLQCSGNLSLGQNIDVDFIDLEWSITPYADIDLTGGNVELFEFGLNGMVSVQAQASVNLGTGVDLTGKCGPNLPDINLPGVFVYGIDIRPTIFPAANISVSASANASAGWVPLSGLERSWELQSGVRYTDAQGWESVNDYTASGSQPAATGFDVDAALALELAARAEVGAGLSFCLGTCTFFPSLIDLTFLEAAGGPYWRLEMPAPISVDDPDYLGPAMTIGVDAGATAGVAGEFFESGILAYLPISGSFSLMTPVFEEDWTYFETEVTGSVDCDPTCGEIPEGSGTIDMTLAMDSGAAGTATFWLEQPGSGQLTQIASSAFSSGQATASHPTDNLPTGEYSIYGRLELDDAAYWFADLLPLAPGAAIGTFTVGDDDGGNPPPSTSGFVRTEGSYDYQADLDAACASEFGPDYRLADWTELVDYYESGGSMDDFFADTGLTLDDKSAHVTRDGERFYTSSRGYFISRHDHNLPGHYFSHDNIDNHLVDLGSWSGSKKALCTSGSAGTGNVYTEDFSQDPGWQVLESSNAATQCESGWESPGHFRSKVADQSSAWHCFGQSLEFAQVDPSKDFRLEFRFNPIEPDWGHYPGIYFVPASVVDRQTLNAVSETVVRFSINWSDHVNKKLRLFAGGEDVLSPTIPSANEWYSVVITYQADSSTVDLEVLRDNGDSFFTHEGLEFPGMTGFEKVLVGEIGGGPSYGSSARVAVDDIRVSVTD